MNKKSLCTCMKSYVIYNKITIKFIPIPLFLDDTFKKISLFIEVFVNFRDSPFLLITYLNFFNKIAELVIEIYKNPL